MACKVKIEILQVISINFHSYHFDMDRMENIEKVKTKFRKVEMVIFLNKENFQ